MPSDDVADDATIDAVGDDAVIDAVGDDATGSATEQRGFERSLGLLDCVLLSVGGMVGSAIFVFPGATGQLVGPAAILAWALAGVLMSTIALCYVELSLAFPEAGGPAVFPARTFGPWPAVRAFASYLEGVCYTIGWAFGITVSALAIADYVAIVAPAAGGHVVAIALAGIAMAVGLNLLGVDVTSRTNLVLAALLLAVLVVFVGLGLAHAAPANYRPFVLGGPLRFAAAIQVAITAYGAWTAIPASAAEIRRPTATIPKAILASLAISTVLYAVVVATVHGVVAPGAFVEGAPVMTTPLGVAADSLGMPVFQRYLLPLAAIAAIFTTMLVGTLSAGRVLYALGDNGTLPGSVAAMTERTGVPWVGIVAIGALSAAMATVPSYFYQLLVVAAVLGTGLPYAINLLSFVGLRHYRTDVVPDFRAPGGDALPIVAFLALAVAMFGLGATEVVWSAGALAVVVAGFAVRYLTAPEAVLGSGE